MQARNSSLQNTADCWAFTLRYGNDDTKCHTKAILRKVKFKTEKKNLILD